MFFHFVKHALCGRHCDRPWEKDTGLACERLAALWQRWTGARSAGCATVVERRDARPHRRTREVS